MFPVADIRSSDDCPPHLSGSKIILILQGLPTCLYGAIFCKEVVSSINIFLIIH